MEQPNPTEVKVYYENQPVGFLKVRDGQMLLYPNKRESRHITTQNLNEVQAFFRKELIQRSR